MATVMASASELASLLSEFGSAPGNFPVRLREPSELYDQLETVAAWALGKVPAELSDCSDSLSSAAVLFVQRACFAAGNNHYEVLGFRAGNLDQEVLRARYRALIRLTHPDMGVAGLPATAAGTVNRAYEVLSDAELRSRYDEVLRKRETVLQPQTEASVKRIALTLSFGERWQSLMASHPVLMRTGFVFGVLGVLCATILSWVAFSSKGSSSMIVARAGVAEEINEAAPLPRKQWPDTRDVVGASSVVGGTAKTAETRSLPTPIKEAAAVTASSLQRGTSGVVGTAKVAEPNLPATAPPATPATTTLKHLGNMYGWAEQRPPDPEQPASVAASSPAGVSRQPATLPTSPATAPSPTQFAGNRNAQTAGQVNTSPAVSSAQTVAARSNVSGGTGPAATSPTFPVDAARAKTYLTDILMSLERPSNARSTNAYLSEMNVQGSLLQPALQLMRKYPEINIENMNWQDNLRPGVMKVQGVVVMTARSANSAESRKVAFQLNAEFWGLRDGTFLASLNMKEED